MRCDRLVLALLITACGGAPAGGVDAGVMDAGPDGGVDAGFDAATEVDAAVDETADPEALATAFRERACAKARRCESIFRTDVDAFCHPGYRSHVWEEMLAAWRAGRARYDAEAARACLEAIEAEACSIRAIDPGPPVCLEAVVGTVPEGACATAGRRSSSHSARPVSTASARVSVPIDASPAPTPVSHARAVGDARVGSSVGTGCAWVISRPATRARTSTSAVAPTTSVTTARAPASP